MTDIAAEVRSGTCTKWRFRTTGFGELCGDYEYRNGTYYCIAMIGGQKFATSSQESPSVAMSKMQTVWLSWDNGRNWQPTPKPEIIQLLGVGIDSATFLRQDGCKLIILTKQLNPYGCDNGKFYRWNGLFDLPEFKPVQVEWKEKAC